MTLYLGVDPGKSGALAVIEADGRARDVVLMPVVTGDGRPEYDVPVIRDLLLAWKGEGVFVTVEKQQPMPLAHGGTIANFNRGMGRAGWEWLLVALKIPHQLVAPRTWQAVMHAGTSGTDTKQRSIIACHRLFPDVSLTKSARANKDLDGKAEALLLAEYGRRTALGRSEAINAKRSQTA